MDLKKYFVDVIIAILMLSAVIAVIIAVSPVFGWRIDAVLSGSMEPAIQTGGVAVIGPVSVSDIHVGDVIAYKIGNLNVCHRVIQVSEGEQLQFTTKGDANNAPDPAPVLPGNVIGRVVFSVPLAGYLISFVKTPVGLFITVLLPLLILIGIELKNVIFDGEDAPRDPKHG